LFATVGFERNWDGTQHMAIDTATGPADTGMTQSRRDAPVHPWIPAGPGARAGENAPGRRNLFTLPGIALVISAFLSALVSFAILLGLTPIEPVDQVVLAAVVINLVFVIGLVTLVFLEIRSLLRARRRGKAAAKLHIRVVGAVLHRGDSARHSGRHRRLDHA
jgi:two-component system nitrogen regulation sensor histidine kinase NtrY